MKKKIVAILLSAVLCIGLIGAAFATPGFVDDGEYGDKIGNSDPFATPAPTPPPTPTPAPTPNPGGGNWYPSDPSYNVTDGSGSNENGSWTTDRTSATSGTTVTITVTPKDGYEGKPVVKDASGGSVTVTDLGNGRYSFTMPASRVTVSVEFTPVAPAITFTDVAPGAYYADAVAWAVANGITNGTGDGKFSPNDPCTRAQIVTFLWRAMGSQEVAPGTSFTDVAPGAYYEKAVAWAVANGITNGTGDGKFSPNDPCTRAQAVTFLHRAEKLPAASGSSFSDVASGAYYANAVSWAVANGITNGTGNGRFSPDDTCTRGQIVTFLYRDMAS